MKITGTRSYIDVEIGKRTARFSGELGINGFYAAKNSIHWLSPHESQPITAEECNQIVEKMVRKILRKVYKTAKKGSYSLKYGSPYGKIVDNRICKRLKGLGYKACTSLVAGNIFVYWDKLGEE